MPYIMSTLAYRMISTGMQPVSKTYVYGGYYEDPFETWESIAEAILTADDFDIDTLYLVPVPETSWGDYHGTDYQRSNARSMHRDDPAVFHTERRYGDIVGLSVPLMIDDDAFGVGRDEHPHRDVEAADAWIATFERLREDYPLSDENDHSALIAELTEETWGRYLGSDVHDAASERLQELGVPDLDDRNLSIEDIHRAFWELYRDSDADYPYAETATSVVIPGWEDTARELADRIADGFDPTQTEWPCAGCGAACADPISAKHSAHTDGSVCAQTALPIAV